MRNSNAQTPRTHDHRRQSRRRYHDPNHHSTRFAADTAQTRGSQRLAAVARDRGIATGLWAGIFTVEPGARTGIYHHGKQETVAYVLEGQCRIRWGERGEFDAAARAGDFIHVPSWVPHMEINGSDRVPL